MSTFQPRKATSIIQDAEQALELANVSLNYSTRYTDKSFSDLAKIFWLSSNLPVPRGNYFSIFLNLH